MDNSLIGRLTVVIISLVAGISGICVMLIIYKRNVC